MTLLTLLLLGVLSPSQPVRIVCDPHDLTTKSFAFAEKELAEAIRKTGREVELIQDAQAKGDIRIGSSGDQTGEAFAMGSGADGTTIAAKELPGRVYGTLRLAREIALRGKFEGTFDLTVAPATKMRMVDAEPPFYPPEPHEEWREGKAWEAGYRNLYNISDAPYLDRARFDQIPARFEKYCQISLKNGFNTMVFIQGENRLVDPEIWKEVSLDPAQRQRLQQWRQMYGKLLQIAADYGIKSYIWTSEVTLPKPVVNRLTSEGVIIKVAGGQEGSASIQDPRLYAEMEKKYTYLTKTYPQIEGFMLRVGELGEPGALIYTGAAPADKALTPPQRVGKFFGEMETLFERKLHKPSIMRTWWVGDPSIHTDPEMYKQATEDLKSSNTWVSIKNTYEFWGAQRPNPTLPIAGRPTLVEYQGFREYDGMNSVPAVVIDHSANSIKSLEGTPKQGIWAWAQFGGHGSPYRITYFYGFTDWSEANLYAMGRLAWEPNVSADQLRHEIALLKVGPKAAAAYEELLRLAESTRNKGLYVAPVTNDYNWHPMFPTYRSYFYAGEIFTGDKTDPVKWIFEKYKSKRKQMVGDMNQALAERKRCVELARQIGEETDPAYAKALLYNCRDGEAVQQVLADWISTAAALYDWEDAESPAEGKAEVAGLLKNLEADYAAYQRDFDEYRNKGYGVEGFIKAAKKAI